MSTKTIWAREIKPGDTVNGQEVEEVISVDDKRIVLLMYDRTYIRLWREQETPVAVADWNALTRHREGVLGSKFYGFEVSREFLEPIWTNVCSSFENELDMVEENGDTVPEEARAEIVMARMEKILGLILHGDMEELPIEPVQR